MAIAIECCPEATFTTRACVKTDVIVDKTGKFVQFGEYQDAPTLSAYGQDFFCNSCGKLATTWVGRANV